MLIAIGERVNERKMSDARVAKWEETWKRLPLRAMLTTPAMVRGTARARLNRLAAVDRVINLLPPDNRPGTWDQEFARDQARWLRSYLYEKDADSQWSGIILMGRRVTAAFDGPQEFGFTTYVGPVKALVIPHPSGRSGFWRQPKIEEKVRDEWIPLITS